MQNECTVNVNQENMNAEVDISMSEGKQKPDLKPYVSDARNCFYINKKINIFAL